MATAIHHAMSSARKWGGEPEDYLKIHEWFDATKAHLPDFRHRALRHHAEGIVLMEQIFGPAITLASGKVIPTKWVGEGHVIEDFGRIPLASEWLQAIKPAAWMTCGARRLSKELEASCLNCEYSTRTPQPSSPILLTTSSSSPPPSSPNSADASPSARSASPSPAAPTKAARKAAR